jgi:hypothetical protein
MCEYVCVCVSMCVHDFCESGAGYSDTSVCARESVCVCVYVSFWEGVGGCVYMNLYRSASTHLLAFYFSLTHTHTHTNTLAHAHTHTHTHKHSRTRSHTHTHKHSRTRSYTHTHKHSRTRSHTHACRVQVREELEACVASNPNFHLYYTLDRPRCVCVCMCVFERQKVCVCVYVCVSV